MLTADVVDLVPQVGGHLAWMLLPHLWGPGHYTFFNPHDEPVGNCLQMRKPLPGEVK